jgi:hypothetical protein
MSAAVAMTNGELRAAAEGARALAAEPLPVALALKLAALVRQLQGPVQDLDAVQMRIVEAYTERDAEGNPVPVVDSDGAIQPGAVRLTDPEGFAREMRELLEAEVELPARPLQRAELEEAGIRVSAETLLRLGELLQA